jgi:hypothetical protein
MTDQIEIILQGTRTGTITWENETPVLPDSISLQDIARGVLREEHVLTAAWEPPGHDRVLILRRKAIQVGPVNVKGRPRNVWRYSLLVAEPSANAIVEDRTEPASLNDPVNDRLGELWTAAESKLPQVQPA